MSSCNEIDFVPSLFYVTLLLKGWSTMRKVVLRMNEDFKYSLIKRLVDSNGNKSVLLFRSTVPFTPNRIYLLGC